jgi:hypothetical protein
VISRAIVSGARYSILWPEFVMIGVEQYGQAMTIVWTILNSLTNFAPRSFANQPGCVVTGTIVGPEIELVRLHRLLAGLPKDAALKHERFGFDDVCLIDLAGLSGLEGWHVGGLLSE